MSDRPAGSRHGRAIPLRAGIQAASASAGLTRRQAGVLVVVFALVVGGLALAAALVKPSNARSFDLFHGSILLADKNAPVAVNLADGKPTVRLIDANQQVNAANESEVDTVALDSSTLLLDRSSGEFNLVDSTGFVVKTTAGGVPLPVTKGSTGAVAVAAGASAYIVQTAPSSTAVYLVGENTVESAENATATVKPRAFATIADGTPAGAPGLAAEANGSLWLLTGSTGTRTVRQLSVPPNSDAGVELDDRTRATVSGTAAIGVATRDADGAGGDIIGVAGVRQVQLFLPDGSSRTVPVAGVSSATQILPVSNSGGSLAFLYRTGAAWSLLTVPTTGSPTATVHQLGKIGTAPLAVPAMSNGAIYTMELGEQSRLWTISASGAVSALAGRAVYPTQKSSTGAEAEAGGFADGEVVARGSRVIFNSPQHALALTAFTDGSHAPVIVDKSTAIDLNATGGAAALKGLQPAKTQPSQAPAQSPVTPPVQNVDNQINCATSDQIPHIPAITSAVAAARSVVATWTYPLLDPRDCVPSTYVVTIKLLSSDAPQAPGQVTVQGQQAVNVVGLFPNTQYQLTVTAFINGHGTPSSPVNITTGREGPAAPTGVRTSSDGNGNWTISWQSCGSAANGCVPAAAWNVIPHFCDGVGVSSPPATFTIAGDETLSTFTASLHADDSDLGRGLSFDVQGVGTLGDAGTTAGDGSCTYSWQSPIASAFSLSASTPPTASFQGTTSSTLTLSINGDTVQATGGVGGQFVYELISDGKIEKVGPTSAMSATFSDLVVGTDYQAAVLISPPRHPEVTVQIGPIPIAAASESWPAITVSASSTDTDTFNGTLTVTISGISSATADGETFSLRNSSLECTNVSLPLSKSGFDPATPLTFSFSRLLDNGSCSVDITLVESSSGIFGGTPSPAASTTVSVDKPGFNQSPTDFAAVFGSSDGQTSTVTITNNGGNPGFVLDGNWSYTLSDGDAADGNCFTAANGSAPPATLTVKTSCVQSRGDKTGWAVTVGYTYLGSPQHATVTLSGTPPTYTAPPPTTTPPTGTPTTGTPTK